LNDGVTELEQATEWVEGLRLSDATKDLLDARALQRREETKFILPLEALRAVLATMTTDAALVRARGEAVAHYDSQYFDTEDFLFAREHHRGRRSRYKVRIRHHVSRQRSFLEIKEKTNANVTAKSRARLPFQHEALGDDERAFIDAHNPVASGSLVPSIRTGHGRITLVGLRTMERVTFDVGLNFQVHGQHEGFPGLVIGEIKQDRYQPRSPLMLAFRQAALRPTGFSKYCMAALLMLPNLTMNRYYPTLRAVRKVCHD
jgi:hypothetical protein